MEKIRILYVIENERFGGGEKAFAQLVRGLDASRFEVFAACLADPSVPGSGPFLRAVEGKARLFNLDLRRLVSPEAVFSLRKIISDSGARIVHSQGPRADFYTRLAAGAAGGVKIISTVASPVEEYDVGPARKAVYSALDRFRSGRVDGFVSVAGHIEAKLLRKGVPAGKVYRIYNGVDTAFYAPRSAGRAGIRASYNIPPDSFLVGAFSRLSAEKGLFCLVEAAGILARAGAIPARRMIYLIAGEGPLEAALKARIERAGLEKDFVFTGFLPDIRPLLGGADLFVLPSLREGFPLTLLEAMAMGKAAAASAIAGVDEIVTPGLNGLLVPPGNPAALAAAISALYNDKPRAAALGLNARETVVARFGLEKMIAAHEELYLGLAAGDGALPRRGTGLT